mgnify:CR=1 FL=1
MRSRAFGEESVHGLVDDAVAAERHDDVESVAASLRCKLRRVVGPLCRLDVQVEFVGQGVDDDVGDAG